MAAKKMKTSEKATLLGKLTTMAKKKYGGKVPSTDLGVLETFLLAACLENNIDEPAMAAYTKMLDSFHDLNEIRVSTVREIERTLASLPEPEFRAMRIREGLQHVFEAHFAFDLDGLKKKNQDNAAADLEATKEATPFMKLFTLQAGLGAHVIPLDDHQLSFLRWLGLVESKTTADGASDELKAAVRKSDGALFAYHLRHVANEPVVIEEISLTDDSEEATPAERLKLLGAMLDGKHTPKPKPAPKAKKKAPAKKATKEAATKKATAKKSAKKAASKKAATKRPAKKKAATKKKATKK